MNNPHIKFGIGFLSAIIAYMTWKKFRKKSPKALGDFSDPDVKILLDIENHIHPDAKKHRAKEMGPKTCQIYAVKLFDKEWCDALVRVSEKYGTWGNASKGGGESVGMTLSLDFMSELQKKYSDAIKKYVFPCASKLFPTFSPTHHDEVYILRYVAGKDGQEKMDDHYDGEPLACILGLNDEFVGGGTHFPKFNVTVHAKPGVILLYPGGLSHLHRGKKITKGRRYLILHAIYDKVLNGDSVSVWEEGEPQHAR